MPCLSIWPEQCSLQAFPWLSLVHFIVLGLSSCLHKLQKIFSQVVYISYLSIVPLYSTSAASLNVPFCLLFSFLFLIPYLFLLLCCILHMENSSSSLKLSPMIRNGREVEETKSQWKYWQQNDQEGHINLSNNTLFMLAFSSWFSIPLCLNPVCLLFLISCHV